MAWGNIERVGPHFGAKGRGKHLALAVAPVGPRAGLGAWLLSVYCQRRLANANRRQVEQHTHMRGYADLAGVSNALPVEKREVGPLLYLLERREDSRAFPEREQPWHIGKIKRFLRSCHLYYV